MHPATRIPLPAPVFVGTSPAGVEYWARYEGDAERMAARLEHHRNRAADRTERRVDLTPAQADRIDSLLSEEAVANFIADGVTFRRTYVQGPALALADLADRVDPDDVADMAAESAFGAQSDEEVLFAARSGYAAALLLRSRLLGRTMTLANARKAARRARF